MKFDLDSVLLDEKGATLVDDGSPATVRNGLKKALVSPAVKDEEKLKRFDLYLKLRSAEADTDFTLDEVQLLVKAVAVYPTLIMGQLTYLLNQKPYNLKD